MTMSRSSLRIRCTQSMQPLVSAVGALPARRDKAKRAPGRRSVADVRHPVGGVERTAHPGEGHYREPHN